MRLEPATSPALRRAFHALPAEVYRGMPQHRSTEDEIVHMLVSRQSVFFQHARLEPFVALDGERVVARFALVHDSRRPEYVQVAFFEALPGASGLLEAILPRARERFPECTRLVAGLNGHLNYSAGFLASNFEEPPLFGLPHTPPYYLDCFRGLARKEMFSYRFETAPFYARPSRMRPRARDLTFRVLDRRHLAREVAIYTHLNNACFQKHPYWADRTPEEDLELFEPFRFFLDDENLIFAERNGTPVGFLLWYPDFNELARAGEPLGLRHLLRYRVLGKLGGRRMRSLRLTEIAVLPELRGSWVVAGLIHKLTELTEGKGFSHCEGGFIFEENGESVTMTLAVLRHVAGIDLTPYRRYCVFEGPL